MKIISIFTCLAFCFSCSNLPNAESIERAKKEILKTEKAFEALVKNEGMAKGFSFYADDSVVINRDNRLLKGRDSVRAFYSQERFKNLEVIWDATYVNVAASCDLGYTYGTYTYTIADSTGAKNEYKGFFHTVWKRQSDGSWKYVWD